jgi:hypothetical protein
MILENFEFRNLEEEVRLVQIKKIPKILNQLDEGVQSSLISSNDKIKFLLVSILRRIFEHFIWLVFAFLYFHRFFIEISLKVIIQFRCRSLIWLWVLLSYNFRNKYRSREVRSSFGFVNPHKENILHDLIHIGMIGILVVFKVPV